MVCVDHATRRGGLWRNDVHISVEGDLAERRDVEGQKLSIRLMGCLWGTFDFTKRPPLQGDKMKKLSLIAFVFMLAACSLGGSEFSKNQKKWSDANITHYRFELNIGCFCAFRSQMPLKVEAQNGEIVSITAPDGSVIAKTDANYKYYSKYATINRLFSELKADLGGKADAVTVTYDPTYGFPATLNIDFIKNAVDDELYLSASAFEMLP